MGDVILSVKNLNLKFNLRGRELHAIRDVSLDLYKGESLAIVGESGSGKSVFTKCFMGLNDLNGHIESGEIVYDGKDLAKFTSEKDWLPIRGGEIAMVMQDPMTSLNPLKTIGAQIVEAIMLHQKADKAAANAQMIEVLKDVGIDEPERRAKQYPHEFSGGMRQRVVIAIAVACKPQILICDEPTTALDVTIQAQVLDLLRGLQSEMGTSILFITHDLGVIAEIADDVSVMYAGRIVETSDIQTVFDQPLHPYTQGLMASRTDVSEGEIFTGANRKLPCIPGNVPTPNNLPKGCSFAPRCSKCMGKCMESMPELVDVGNGHQVRCWLYEKGAE